MFETLTSLTDTILDRGIPGYSLTVLKDGKEIFRYTAGVNDLENGIPTTGHEKYNLYSLSKIITCTGALLLVEEGKLRLSDKVSDYLPEFANLTVRDENGIRPAKTPLTVYHLFTMTAGIGYEIDQNPAVGELRKATKGRCPTREMMKAIAKQPLHFEPGEGWIYGLCHDVLAAIIEVITGERFSEYIDRRIFKPLGMKDSTFLLPASMHDTVAPQYMIKDGKTVNIGKEIMTYKMGSEYESGGAGCISTPDDYLKFGEALRTGKILRPETLAMMTTNQLTVEQEMLYTSSDRYGYGLGVRTPRGTHWDFGWGGAAGCYFGIIPTYGITFFFGMQVMNHGVVGERKLIPDLIIRELAKSGAVFAPWLEAENDEKIRNAKDDGILSIT